VRKAHEFAEKQIALQEEEAAAALLAAEALPHHAHTQEPPPSDDDNQAFKAGMAERIEIVRLDADGAVKETLHDDFPAGWSAARTEFAKLHHGEHGTAANAEGGCLELRVGGVSKMSTKVVGKERKNRLSTKDAVQPLIDADFEAGSVEESYAAVLAQAEAGDATAQFQLGVMYHRGVPETGIEPDHVSAALWFSKAAEAGLSSAQCSFGLLHLSGHGVPTDDIKAALWLRRAADAGVSLAQNHYGRLLSMGIGVPKDLTLAVEYFQKAADQGQADAMVNLGAALLVGRGIQKDEAKARTLISAASAQGDADATQLLSIMIQKTLTETEEAKRQIKAANVREHEAKRQLEVEYAKKQRVVRELLQFKDEAVECPVPLTVRGTQVLVGFAPLAPSVFCAARQNAVLRRSPLRHT